MEYSVHGGIIRLASHKQRLDGHVQVGESEMSMFIVNLDIWSLLSTRWSHETTEGLPCANSNLCTHSWALAFISHSHISCQLQKPSCPRNPWTAHEKRGRSTGSENPSTERMCQVYASCVPCAWTKWWPPLQSLVAILSARSWEANFWARPHCTPQGTLFILWTVPRTQGFLWSTPSGESI